MNDHIDTLDAIVPLIPQDIVYRHYRLDALDENSTIFLITLYVFDVENRIKLERFVAQPHIQAMLRLNPGDRLQVLSREEVLQRSTARML